MRSTLAHRRPCGAGYRGTLVRLGRRLRFNQMLRDTLAGNTAQALLPYGDFGAGGCVLLAKALEPLIPGIALVMIGRKAINSQDHMAVQLANGADYVDYLGVQSRQRLVRRYTGLLPPNQQHWPVTLAQPDWRYLNQQGMVPNEATVAELQRLLMPAIRWLRA